MGCNNCNVIICQAIEFLLKIRIWIQFAEYDWFPNYENCDVYKGFKFRSYWCLRIFLYTTSCMLSNKLLWIRVINYSNILAAFFILTLCKWKLMQNRSSYKVLNRKWNTSYSRYTSIKKGCNQNNDYFCHYPNIQH